MDPSANKKHSVSINGHRTSITLEAAFWTALKDIAAAEGVSLNTLVAKIDLNQPENLSSALRVFVLEHFKKNNA